jgi:hypothetical protein
MNEVAAPFLYLNPPPNGEALSYVLYEGLCPSLPLPLSFHLSCSVFPQLSSFAILRTSSVETSPLFFSKPSACSISCLSMSIHRSVLLLSLSLQMMVTVGTPSRGAAFPPGVVLSSVVFDSLQPRTGSPSRAQVFLFVSSVS